MTLEQWANMGEIVAAVAVIISLAYLGVQVRQSNVLSKAQTSQSMVQMAQQEILCLRQPELWFAFSSDEITEEDKVNLNAFLTASMRQREYEWLSRKEGIIDAEMYESYAGAIVIALGTERTRRWWKVNGHNHSFTPGFVEDVDSRLSQSPLSDFWTSLDQW